MSESDYILNEMDDIRSIWARRGVELLDGKDRLILAFCEKESNFVASITGN